MSDFEKKLQDKIAEKKNGNKKGDKEDEKPLTKKEKLVEDYLKVKKEYLQKFHPKEYLEFEREDFDKLRRVLYKKKGEILEKELAEMFAKLANNMTMQDRPVAQAGAETLWQLNVVLTHGIEQLTDGIDKAIKYRNPAFNKCVSLKGITQDTLEKEQIMKPIFQEIYAEYREQIDEYVSCWTKLYLIYGQMIMNRLALNNMQQKEEQTKNDEIIL